MFGVTCFCSKGMFMVAGRLKLGDNTGGETIIFSMLYSCPGKLTLT